MPSDEGFALRPAAAGYARRHDEAAQLLPLFRLVPGAHRARAQGPAYDYVPVHLARASTRPAPFADDLARHAGAAARRPTASALSQSMAIIEYLDETHPEPPLLPRDAAGRAHVRALAQIDRLRDPSAQQPAGAQVPGARTQARRRGQERLVPPLGARRPGGLRAPAGAAAGRRPTATATRRRWPTAAWCRRSSTASASTATSAACRARWPPSRPACSSTPSRRRSRRAARTPRLSATLGRRLDCWCPTGPRRPACVRCARTRDGGVSPAPYESLNLGDHVGDEPARRRGQPAALAGGASARGRSSCSRCMAREVVPARCATRPTAIAADACMDRRPRRRLHDHGGRLPAGAASPTTSGTRVAAAHAGWRGLAGGRARSERWRRCRRRGRGAAPVHGLAGPCIGPDAFEVGDEVRAAFVARDADAARCFRAAGTQPASGWPTCRAWRGSGCVRPGVDGIHGNDGSAAGAP